MTESASGGGARKERRKHVCQHGAECRHCGVIASGRTVFTQSDGRPHPYPHRHFKCENPRCPFLFTEGNLNRIRAGKDPRPWFWNVTIPKQQLRDKPEGLPT